MCIRFWIRKRRKMGHKQIKAQWLVVTDHMTRTATCSVDRHTDRSFRGVCLRTYQKRRARPGPSVPCLSASRGMRKVPL